MAARQKKVKPTRTQAAIINEKQLGKEPVFSKEKMLTRLDQMKAYNWYNYMRDSSQGYKYLLDYAKEVDPKLFKAIKSVDEKYFSNTVFWIARLKSLGYTLQEDSNEFFRKKIKEAFLKKQDNASDEPEKKEEKKKFPNIQDRIRDRRSDIIGMIEEKIDACEYDFSLYDYLTKNEIPKMYCTHIIAYYVPHLDEINEVLDGSDPQLKEGYRPYTKKQVREMKEFFEKILEDAHRFASNQKTVKKRKQRTVSSDKKVKNFNYKPEDKDFQIVSMNPASIIGASEVWIFNVKYSSLTVFRSSSTNGLDIKGTTIMNFDESISMTKRTGKKAPDFIKEVLTGGKRSLAKLMDNINTKPGTLSGRTTKDAVILKII
jgi:hypothetical protein